MNELAHGSVALGLELRAGDRNNFIPLLAPTGRVIVRHQEVGQNQSAAGMRRKRRRSGVAGLRAGQHGAEFGAEPERLQRIVSRVSSRISDPDYFASREIDGEGGRQFSIWDDGAAGIHEEWTIRQTLPVLWPEEPLWDQMVRLIVQPAVEERSGKFISPIRARGSYCELLNPCQPCRVFHL
jgi:hypothetical protein